MVEVGGIKEVLIASLSYMRPFTNFCISQSSILHILALAGLRKIHSNHKRDAIN